MKRYPSLTPRLDEVVHEQRTLLEAIVRGDGDAAERSAAQHVLTFEGEIRQLI
jgi:DNA-binding GntR family transcriptional regulator